MLAKVPTIASNQLQAVELIPSFQTQQLVRYYSCFKILIRLATRSIVSIARSSCARVCSLVTMARMRALPSGTVGNAMPVAITPSSKSARENSMAARPSPTIIGVMGVSVAGVVTPPMLKATRRNPPWKYRVFSHRRSMRSGSRSKMLKASMQEAATEGGCEVEKRNGRARW